MAHDGHPLLYGPPLVDLQGSCPLEQPLMPHLVPQSINMWMGCAPGGELCGPTQTWLTRPALVCQAVKVLLLAPLSRQRL